MWTRITSSKSRLRVTPYLPNLVAKKFVLSQLLPTSLVPQADTFSFSTDTPNERWLKSYHLFYKMKEVFLNSFKFSLSYRCTQEFEDWWALYYADVPNHTLMAQCLVDAFSFMRDQGNICKLALKWYSPYLALLTFLDSNAFFLPFIGVPSNLRASTADSQGINTTWIA